jgi:hypothetical protein
LWIRILFTETAYAVTGIIQRLIPGHGFPVYFLYLDCRAEFIGQDLTNSVPASRFCRPAFEITGIRNRAERIVAALLLDDPIIVEPFIDDSIIIDPIIVVLITIDSIMADPAWLFQSCH